MAVSSSTNPLCTYKPLSELYIISSGKTSWVMNKGRNLAFHNYKNEKAIYFLEIANNCSGENSVVLHQGDSKTGARIAQVSETATSGEFLIRGPMGAENMTRVGNDAYIWTVPSALCPPKLPPYEPDDPDKKSTFRWIKTPRVEGKIASFAAPDWKLSDKESGEVHAVFVENWDGTTDRGRIQFRRSFGECWEMSVLVSVGILAEGARARRYRRGTFTRGFMLW